MMRSILILGGTTEARMLAQRLADRNDLSVTLSLAGRTRAPLAMPVPVISGGFGGVEGLAHWLRRQGIDILVDATHPFAAIMSHSAVAAAQAAGIPLIALRRAAWEEQPGDRWTVVPDAAAAIAQLGDARRTVFLTLGRQEAHVANAAPQHRYLVRSVEPIEPPLTVSNVSYLLERGPFAEGTDGALLAAHGIDAVIAKNSGGTASYGKIAAARDLGIDVILIQRPPVPDVPVASSVEEAMAALHQALAGAERGE